MKAATVVTRPAASNLSRWALAGSALLALGAGLASAGWPSSPRQTDPRAPRVVAPGLPAIAGSPAAPVDATEAGPSTKASTDGVDRLWTTGSLRGTELDGDWGRWTAGQLQPDVGLRRRFDSLLSAQGEVGIDALRQWVAAKTTAAVGPAGAAQVLALWDRYLQVQSARYALEANPGDPATWQPALAEHSRIRRELLGAAWAEAFYGADEREVAADAARHASPPSLDARPASTNAAEALLGAPTGPDADPTRLRAARTGQFGAEAAERLQANDTAWQLWEQRIDAARTARAAIEADPALSPQQRREAVSRTIDEQFAADERPRALGLVDALGAAPRNERAPGLAAER